MDAEEIPTAPIETKWQTLIQARGEKAVAALKTSSDGTLLSDDFLKTLAEKHSRAELLLLRVSFYSALFLVVLFVTRYASISEITVVGIKVTEIKGFAEIILFISSVLGIFASLIAVNNGMRKKILQECIKLRAGTAAKTISVAFLDEDLLGEVYVRGANQHWHTAPQLLMVIFAIGLMLYGLLFAAIIFLVRIVVIMDVTEYANFPDIVRYVVLGSAFAAILFGVVSSLIVYFPWPYRDHKNSDSFYALQKTDPKKFEEVFQAWIRLEARRAARRNRTSSAFIFFIFYVMAQYAFRDVSRLVEPEVFINLAFATALTSFLGGAIVTAANAKINKLIWQAPISEESEKMIRYQKSQRLTKLVTFAVPIIFVGFYFVGLGLRFS